MIIWKLMYRLRYMSKMHPFASLQREFYELCREGFCRKNFFSMADCQGAWKDSHFMIHFSLQD